MPIIAESIVIQKKKGKGLLAETHAVVIVLGW